MPPPSAADLAPTGPPAPPAGGLFESYMRERAKKEKPGAAQSRQPAEPSTPPASGGLFESYMASRQAREGSGPAQAPAPSAKSAAAATNYADYIKSRTDGVRQNPVAPPAAPAPKKSDASTPVGGSLYDSYMRDRARKETTVPQAAAPSAQRKDQGSPRGTSLFDSYMASRKENPAASAPPRSPAKPSTGAAQPTSYTEYMKSRTDGVKPYAVAPPSAPMSSTPEPIAPAGGSLYDSYMRERARKEGKGSSTGAPAQVPQGTESRVVPREGSSTSLFDSYMAKRKDKGDVGLRPSSAPVAVPKPATPAVTNYADYMKTRKDGVKELPRSAAAPQQLEKVAPIGGALFDEYMQKRKSKEASSQTSTVPQAPNKPSAPANKSSVEDVKVRSDTSRQSKAVTPTPLDAPDKLKAASPVDSGSLFESYLRERKAKESKAVSSSSKPAAPSKPTGPPATNYADYMKTRTDGVKENPVKPGAKLESEAPAVPISGDLFESYMRDRKAKEARTPPPSSKSSAAAPKRSSPGATNYADYMKTRTDGVKENPKTPVAPQEPEVPTAPAGGALFDSYMREREAKESLSSESFTRSSSFEEFRQRKAPSSSPAREPVEEKVAETKEVAPKAPEEPMSKSSYKRSASFQEYLKQRENAAVEEYKQQQGKKDVKASSDIKPAGAKLSKTTAKPTGKAAAKSSEAAVDASKPAADASKPAADASKPAADASKPAADASKPAAGASKAAADVSKPATGASKPAADVAKPAVDASKAAADVSKPAAGASKPAAGASKPAVGAAKSAAGAAKSAVGASKPAAAKGAGPKAEAKEPLIWDFGEAEEGELQRIFREDGLFTFLNLLYKQNESQVWWYAILVLIAFIGYGCVYLAVTNSDVLP